MHVGERIGQTRSFQALVSVVEDNRLAQSRQSELVKREKEATQAVKKLEADLYSERADHTRQVQMLEQPYSGEGGYRRTFQSILAHSERGRSQPLKIGSCWLVEHQNTARGMLRSRFLCTPG